MFSILVLALTLAATNCAPQQNIIDYLQNKWGETVYSSGVDSNGYIMETTVNKKTGSWSIILTRPMSLTCIVGHGDGWKSINPEELLGEEDA